MTNILSLIIWHVHCTCISDIHRKRNKFYLVSKFQPNCLLTHFFTGMGFVPVISKLIMNVHVQNVLWMHCYVLLIFGLRSEDYESFLAPTLSGLVTTKLERAVFCYIEILNIYLKWGSLSLLAPPCTCYWPCGLFFFFLINISIISNMNNKVDHFNKF